MASTPPATSTTSGAAPVGRRPGRRRRDGLGIAEAIPRRGRVRPVRVGVARRHDAARELHRAPWRHEGHSGRPIVRSGRDAWESSTDGDATVYASQAEAQGYATVHYECTAPCVGVTIDAYYDGSPVPVDPPTLDDYGAVFHLRPTDFSAPITVTVKVNGTPDVVDQVFTPIEAPSAWLQTGEQVVYESRGAAEDFALLHYRRPAGDYGDYASSDFNQFWGVHTWNGALHRPAGRPRCSRWVKTCSEWCSASICSTMPLRCRTSSIAAIRRTRERTSRSCSTPSGTRRGSCRPPTPTIRTSRHFGSSATSRTNRYHPVARQRPTCQDKSRQAVLGWPVTHGDRPRPELMAIHQLEPGCARADQRATSARVRQGPAAQRTRTRRSIPDLPAPAGASRHPRTSPRLAPA